MSATEEISDLIEEVSTINMNVHNVQKIERAGIKVVQNIEL